MGSRKFIGILIIFLVALLLTFIGPWNAAKHTKLMGDAVTSALKSQNLDFANVDMSGNVARLTGTAPNQAMADRAVEVAQGAKCEKCKDKKRSWHGVRNDLDVVSLPTATPYTFNAVKDENGAVTVSGYVGSETARSNVLAKAQALFPGRVTDSKVKLALGAPNDYWSNTVENNLQELTRLDRGRFAMENRQIVITGLAADEGVRNGINTYIANLGNGYEGAANIKVPDLAAVNVGEIKSESVCQTLINDLKDGNKINFAYGKAEIRGAKSFDLLNNLASAAVQCADFRIQIGGHTDADGNDKYNQLLSEARANNVVAYLADNGVELTRMTATGYGEVQPIASNDNPEGMARNRRIEFIVTQSE